MKAFGARRHLPLLAALVAMLAVQPFVARAGLAVAGIADLVFGGLLLVVFLSLCTQRWERRIGALLFVPVAVSDVVLYGLAAVAAHHVETAAAVFHGTVVLFLSFAVVTIVRLLARADVVRIDDVLGAVCGYLVAAIAWSHVFALAYMFVPGSFGVSPDIAAQLADWRLRRVVFDHLSFTTLTTIGFSAITPLGSPLYAITWTETIFGQFYMAVVVAQLVGVKLAQALAGRHQAPR
jgi:hypothetical protein